MRKLIRTVLLAFGALVALAAVVFGVLVYRLSHPSYDRKPLPAELISLESNEGKALLVESNAKADHALLMAHFETQQKGSYCGVASAVTVLNSLSPSSPLTQESFFNACTDEIRSAFRVTFGGMPVEAFGKLVQCHKAETKVYLAESSSLEEFRSVVVESLRRPDDYVVVNYERVAVGQLAGGHISPVSAYHEASDRFLILDMASYKYPPVWVKAEKLWNGMTMVDSESKRTRGFVLIHKASAGERR